MNFKEDFEQYTTRIFKDKLPTAWARYADGERMIIQNMIVGEGTQAYNVDKWGFNNNSTFREDLIKTLYCNDPEYFYAISCKCCDFGGNEFYNNIIQNKNKSYANLWINGNFKKFREIITNITEDVYLMANYKGNQKKYPFPVKEYFDIPDDVCEYYSRNKTEFIENIKNFVNFKNKLVLISAGPLSEIIIYELWKHNKTNRYIDIGSSISDIIHGDVIRPYMVEGSMYYGKECV